MGCNLLSKDTSFILKPVICIAAYNRPDSLKNLLNSINNAFYPFNVRLIISIEYGAPAEIIKLAKEFNHPKLNKDIIIRKERLGCRKHILACGNLTSKYESIILLEDDLIVDKYFYIYSLNAVLEYSKSPDIAGIALYSYNQNELKGIPFYPLNNGFSTYFMQFPCSWGQVWTKSQWEPFYSWYLTMDEDKLNNIYGLPKEIKKWTKHSWKKFFAAYLLIFRKLIIYPYQTFSTNSSGAGGTHYAFKTNSFQVPLNYNERNPPNFNFVGVNNKDVCYDIFFEPIGDHIFSGLNIDKRSLEIDLQGYKPYFLLKKKKYVLTSKPVSKYLKRFQLDFLPPEININFNKLGTNNDFYLAESKYLIYLPLWIVTSKYLSKLPVFNSLRPFYIICLLSILFKRFSNKITYLIKK